VRSGIERFADAKWPLWAAGGRRIVWMGRGASQTADALLHASRGLGRRSGWLSFDPDEEALERARRLAEHAAHGEPEPARAVLETYGKHMGEIERHPLLVALAEGIAEGQARWFYEAYVDRLDEREPEYADLRAAARARAIAALKRGSAPGQIEVEAEADFDRLPFERRGAPGPRARRRISELTDQRTLLNDAEQELLREPRAQWSPALEQLFATVVEQGIEYCRDDLARAQRVTLSCERIWLQSDSRGGQRAHLWALRGTKTACGIEIGHGAGGPNDDLELFEACEERGEACPGCAVHYRRLRSADWRLIGAERKEALRRRLDERFEARLDYAEPLRPGCAPQLASPLLEEEIVARLAADPERLGRLLFHDQRDRRRYEALGGLPEPALGRLAAKLRLSQTMASVQAQALDELRRAERRAALAKR
jgi:hypothetical protein